MARSLGNNFLKDIVGQRYGRLVIRERSERKLLPCGQRRSLVRCICDCGQEAIVDLNNLRRGNSRSCGCLRREIVGQVLARNHEKQITHGESRWIGRKSSPEYQSWAGMIQRCEDPNGPRWHIYGGRGIAVCSEWRNSYETFLAHVGRRPSPKHSIDRYPNPDGNYQPGNVRWATPREQRENRSACG